VTRHVRPSFPTDGDPGELAGVVTMATLGTAFTLLALHVEWFWVVFPVGFGGVLPVAVGAAKRRRARDGERGGRRRGAEAEAGASDGTDAALARLRERYASGDLDEAAFEARLERLLLTEDVATAREFVRGRADGARRSSIEVDRSDDHGVR